MTCRKSSNRVQREQREQINVLNKKLEELSKERAARGEEKAGAGLAAELQKQPPLAAAPQARRPRRCPVVAVSAITLARAGSAYMNISFDTLMAWVGRAPRILPIPRIGDHDPSNAGSPCATRKSPSTARWTLFQGFGNIVLKLDKNNEQRSNSRRRTFNPRHCRKSATQAANSLQTSGVKTRSIRINGRLWISRSF